MLERVKASPDLSPEARDGVSQLSRLVFLWLNTKGYGLSGEADRDIPNHVRKDIRKSVAVVEKFASRLEALPSERIASGLAVNKMTVEIGEISSGLLESLSPSFEETSGGLPERLALAELRDLAAALEVKGGSLPEPVCESIKKIRSATAAFLERRKKDYLPSDAAELRYLRRYLKEAVRIADRLGTAGDEDFFARSVNIFERIADFFISRSREIDTRKQEELSADLSVLDTLLRMDGK